MGRSLLVHPDEHDEAPAQPLGASELEGRLAFQLGGSNLCASFLLFPRRRTPPAEAPRASERGVRAQLTLLDAQAVVALALVYRFGPSLPHLITASPPAVPVVKTHEASKLWKLVAPWIASVSSALSLLAELAQVRPPPPPLAAAERALSDFHVSEQIHLNYRRGTFAGMYRMAAVLRLAFEVLEALPNVFLRIFGDWHTRPPFRFEELFSIGMSSVSAWQAVRYEAVPQVEEEEE